MDDLKSFLSEEEYKSVMELAQSENSVAVQ